MPKLSIYEIYCLTKISRITAAIFDCLLDRVSVRILTSEYHHRTLRKKPATSEIIILECSFPLTLAALCIRKSASQCGYFAWLPCIAALADCHQVMFIDCAMKNASVDAKSTIGLHLKISSWKIRKVKNSHFCARFWEAWRAKKKKQCEAEVQCFSEISKPVNWLPLHMRREPGYFFERFPNPKEEKT